MKKKIILFLFIFIICIGIIGLICYKINNSKEKDVIETLKNIRNISGQYSEVKVKDYETAKESLKDVLNHLKIKDIDKELVTDKIDTTGDYINTYKFSQLYNGIEVYNAGVDELSRLASYDLKGYNYIDFNDDGKYLGK